MSITVSICDDNAEQMKNLRDILSDWADTRSFSVNILEYKSAESFLFDYEENPCDLLLLDIEMQGISGMELAKKLRSAGDMLPVIFVTGYSEYILEGYDVWALHYLLKPIDEKKLVSVLDIYVNRRFNASAAEEILIKNDDGSMHLAACDIMYIEAFGHETHIHLKKSDISCSMGISRFEGMKGFVHCHRSYIVNLKYVKSIAKTSVALDNGKEIPLSRRLYKEVNQRFIEYYTK